MRRNEIKIGHYCAAKISGQLTGVKIESQTRDGWIGRNILTNRRVRIKSAAKLREDVTEKVNQKRSKIRYLYL